MASLKGEEPIALADPKGYDPWFRRVHNLLIEVDEGQSDVVTRIVASDDAEVIIGSLLKPTNRVIKSIRNFGLVTNLRELKLSDVGTDRWLDLFSVQTSTDGTDWTRLREPPDDLAELLASRALLRQENFGQFQIAKLSEVQEAIEDNLDAGPERIFLANALEHLRRGDLRVAVVETVICLEILLAQLLPKLLEKRSVDGETLTKDITLYYRVKMLLPLLLPKEANESDLSAVLKTISWRNKVAHQSGYLPEGVPEQTIRDGISATLLLAHKLANKRDSIQREPGLRQLADELATEFGIRSPSIEWRTGHSYIVQFQFVLDPVPTMGRLEEISRGVIDRLMALDPRCKPETDVFIFFSKILGEVATWQRGRFAEVRTRTHDENPPTLQSES